MRLALLPGLGGDARMFDSQRLAVPGLTTPAWLDPRPGESLTAYAARFAESLRGKEPLVLGGASFGGMVALEMARILKPQAVVLIGSSLEAVDIPRYLRSIGRLAGRLPCALYQGAKALAPCATATFGVAGQKESRSLFLTMLRDSRPDFMRWAVRALSEWQGVRSTVPVIQIHGAKDRILPPRRPDLLVPGAGHLVNMTHPEPVNDVLRQLLARAA